MRTAEAIFYLLLLLSGSLLVYSVSKIRRYMKDHSDNIHTMNLFLHAISFSLFLLFTAIEFAWLMYLQATTFANCKPSIECCNVGCEKINIALICWILIQLAQYSSEIVLCWILWEIGSKSELAAEASDQRNQSIDGNSD
jgi:hypothetical protein